jgi:hypothetical protein
MNGQLEYDFKLDDSGKVYFDQVVEVDSTSQNELFTRAREWFSLKNWLKNKKEKGFWMDNVKSDQGEIFLELLDKEEGKIYAKGRTNILVFNNGGTKLNGGSFTYRITLLFKEGKSRIVIDNLVFESGDMMNVNSGAFINEDYPATFGKFGKSQIRKEWVKMRLEAIKEFESIMNDYKSHMLKNDVKRNDDW